MPSTPRGMYYWIIFIRQTSVVVEKKIHVVDRHNQAESILMHEVKNIVKCKISVHKVLK